LEAVGSLIFRVEDFSVLRKKDTGIMLFQNVCKDLGLIIA
jgi:hypothetical protein